MDTTTKMEIEIPHDRYDIRSIAHERTNRKDDIFMQRRQGQIFICILEWRQGTYKKSRLYPARAYTTLVVLVIFTRVLNLRIDVRNVEPLLGIFVS